MNKLMKLMTVVKRLNNEKRQGMLDKTISVMLILRRIINAFVLYKHILLPKKAILTLLLTVCTFHAHAVLIEVTTTDDQDGEDSENCSLREAVHASLAKEEYGGCIAGQRYFIDTIKLKSGTYTLNKEINIIKRVEKFGRSINIVGADYIDYLQRDGLTGVIGKRELPKSTISAANGNRLFNSRVSGIGLRLDNLVIENAGSASVDRGGALLIGGSVTLNNVFIKNAKAKNQGGAIFLEGAKSSLTANLLLIEDSSAAQGAAISQFCQDNLAADERSIDIKNASIVRNNATGNASSILYSCGPQQMKLENVTFAENKSSLATIDMSDLGVFQSGASLVSPKVNFNRITIVNNDHGIAYASVGSISIKDSVIAFNKTTDCQYNDAKVKLQEQNAISIFSTFFTGDKRRLSSNSCQLKQFINTETGEIIADNSNIYVSSKKYTDFFRSGLTDYGLGLLGYMPKASANNPLQITEARSSCTGSDKRGITREQTVTVDDKKIKSCYLGSLNPSVLTAINDLKNTNSSYQEIVKKYKQRIDAEVPSSYSDRDVKFYNDATQKFRAELQVFKDAFKDKDNKTLQRVALIDVFANDKPAESDVNNIFGIKLFPVLRGVNKLEDGNNYNVSVKALGSSSDQFLKTKQTVNDFAADAGSADNIVCNWLPQVAKLVVYRTDNSLTPAGKFDWCYYTVTDKETGVKSSAYVQVKFVNKAPLVEDLTLETDGYEEKIAIDLNALVSDNNDGPNLEGGDKLYLSENTGKPVYVEITKQPEVGKLIFDNDEEIDCPTANKLQTSASKCFSGKFDYVRYSNSSGFGDTFKYKVYDCGSKKRMVNINIYDEDNPEKIKEVKSIYQCDAKSALASAEATVTINARVNRDKRSIVEGGGAFSVYALFILLSGVLASIYTLSRVYLNK